MSVQMPSREPVCWDCSAINDPGSAECWLCHRQDWSSDRASMPAKTAVSRRSNRVLAGVAAVIGIGASALLCAGIALDSSSDSYFWIYFVPLLIPVVLMIWSRFQTRTRPRQSMTTLEFAAALTTIAAGVVLIGWVLWAGGGLTLMFLLPLWLVAIMITGIIARNRSRQGRPMNLLQQTASVVFMAVLLPGLTLASMCIAFLLVCQAMGPVNFH
jgi:hypothetical protein